jgi:primosomal protein DnaI
MSDGAKEAKDLIGSIRVTNVTEEDEERAVSGLFADQNVRPALESLGVSHDEAKRNLALLLSYQDDKKPCVDCPGLEACPKEMARTSITLQRDDDGFLTMTYGPCDRYLRREGVRLGYLVRDFPDEWLSLNPKSIQPSSQRINDFVAYILAAVSSKEHPWAYVKGEDGSGRSYLTAAVTNFLSSKGARIAFMNVNRRFDELKGLGIKDKKRFDLNMTAFSSCDVLVLDDFGSEFKSDYVRDQILMPLLRARNRDRLPTIFLSSLSIEDIQSLYDYNRSSGVLARQIADMIRKNIDHVHVLEHGVEQDL